MENLKSIIKNEKIKGAIAITAAIIMWFMPDHIERNHRAITRGLRHPKIDFEKG